MILDETLRDTVQMRRKSSWKLLHFHIGSQLSDIRKIKEAVNEGARLYAKMQVSLNEYTTGW